MDFIGGEMMRCRRARVLLTRRLHAALTPADGARLARHLESCPRCREELATDIPFEGRLRRAVAAASAPAPSNRVDPGRVVRRLRELRTRPRAGTGRLLPLAGGAVAAIAIASLVGLALRRSSSPLPAVHGVRQFSRGSQPSVRGPE